VLVDANCLQWSLPFIPIEYGGVPSSFQTLILPFGKTYTVKRQAD
jgi:hypothetical protein